VKHQPRIIFISVSVGLVSAVITTAVTVGILARSGLGWPGEVFGGESFNWRDSLILLLALGAFAATMVPTALLLRKRGGVRACESTIKGL
jgi:hypothetical protein